MKKIIDVLLAWLLVIGAFLGGFAILLGICLILAIPFWLLWNWIIAGLFGIFTITLWQAWGLLFLIGIIRRKVFGKGFRITFRK